MPVGDRYKLRKSAYASQYRKLEYVTAYLWACKQIHSEDRDEIFDHVLVSYTGYIAALFNPGYKAQRSTENPLRAKN